MDQLLGLILALLGFAFTIFMIGRTVKYIVILGLALVALFILTSLGILG